MLFLRVSFKPCAFLYGSIGRKPATEMERSGIEVRSTAKMKVRHT